MNDPIQMMLGNPPPRQSSAAQQTLGLPNYRTELAQQIQAYAQANNKPQLTTEEFDSIYNQFYSDISTRKTPADRDSTSYKNWLNTNLGEGGAAFRADALAKLQAQGVLLAPPAPVAGQESESPWYKGGVAGAVLSAPGTLASTIAGAVGGGLEYAGTPGQMIERFAEENVPQDSAFTPAMMAIPRLVGGAGRLASEAGAGLADSAERLAEMNRQATMTPEQLQQRRDAQISREVAYQQAGGGMSGVAAQFGEALATTSGREAFDTTVQAAPWLLGSGLAMAKAGMKGLMGFSGALEAAGSATEARRAADQLFSDPAAKAAFMQTPDGKKLIETSMQATGGNEQQAMELAKSVIANDAKMWAGTLAGVTGALTAGVSAKIGADASGILARMLPGKAAQAATGAAAAEPARAAATGGLMSGLKGAVGGAGREAPGEAGEELAVEIAGGFGQKVAGLPTDPLAQAGQAAASGFVGGAGSGGAIGFASGYVGDPNAPAKKIDVPGEANELGGDQNIDAPDQLDAVANLTGAPLQAFDNAGIDPNEYMDANKKLYVPDLLAIVNDPSARQKLIEFSNEKENAGVISSQLLKLRTQAIADPKAAIEAFDFGDPDSAEYTNFLNKLSEGKGKFPVSVANQDAARRLAAFLVARKEQYDKAVAPDETAIDKMSREDPSALANYLLLNNKAVQGRVLANADQKTKSALISQLRGKKNDGYRGFDPAVADTFKIISSMNDNSVSDILKTLEGQESKLLEPTSSDSVRTKDRSASQMSAASRLADAIRATRIPLNIAEANNAQLIAAAYRTDLKSLISDIGKTATPEGKAILDAITFSGNDIDIASLSQIIKKTAGKIATAKAKESAKLNSANDAEVADARRNIAILDELSRRAEADRPGTTAPIENDMALIFGANADSGIRKAAEKIIEPYYLVDPEAAEAVRDNIDSFVELLTDKKQALPLVKAVAQYLASTNQNSETRAAVLKIHKRLVEKYKTLPDESENEDGGDDDGGGAGKGGGKKKGKAGKGKKPTGDTLTEKTSNKGGSETPNKVGSLSFSIGFPEDLKSLSLEWTKLLKLDGEVVSFYTKREATKSEKFSRRTKSLIRRANGVLVTFEDGTYSLVVDTDTLSQRSYIETLAHELGHMHEDVVFKKASNETKKAIISEYNKWKKKSKNWTAKELVENLRSYQSAMDNLSRVGDSLSSFSATKMKGYGNYWSSFPEWYADNVARWATTTEKPVSSVDKFFKSIADTLRKFFNDISNAGWFANKTFAEYMDGVTAAVKDVQPAQEAGQTAPAPQQEEVQTEQQVNAQQDAEPVVPQASQAAIQETIDVDGVKRPTRNSDGRQIHPTEEGIRNFWRWFGDSKITRNWEGEEDSDKPRVLYHATPKNFSVFAKGRDATDPLGRTSGPVIFMAADKERINAYHNLRGDGLKYKSGEGRDIWIKEGVNVMPVYASIKNPLFVDAENKAKERERIGLGDGFPYLFTGADVAALKSLGYDGVVNFHEDPDGETAAEVIAFDNYQVKSATGNDGNFSSNPDITASREKTGVSDNILWAGGIQDTATTNARDGTEVASVIERAIGKPVQPGDVQIVDPVLTREEARVIQAITGGKPVVFYTVKDGTPGSSARGFFDPANPGRVYVRAAKGMMAFVAGHEFAHMLQLGNPTLFNELQAKLQEMAKAGVLIDDEAVADTWGAMVTGSTRALNAVGQNTSPGFFSRVLEAISKFWNEKIRGIKNEILNRKDIEDSVLNGLYTDAEAVKAIVHHYLATMVGNGQINEIPPEARDPQLSKAKDKARKERDPYTIDSIASGVNKSTKDPNAPTRRQKILNRHRVFAMWRDAIERALGGILSDSIDVMSAILTASGVGREINREDEARYFDPLLEEMTRIFHKHKANALKSTADGGFGVHTRVGFNEVISLIMYAKYHATERNYMHKLLHSDLTAAGERQRKRVIVLAKQEKISPEEARSRLEEIINDPTNVRKLLEDGSGLRDSEILYWKKFASRMGLDADLDALDKKFIDPIRKRQSEHLEQSRSISAADIAYKKLLGFKHYFPSKGFFNEDDNFVMPRAIATNVYDTSFVKMEGRASLGKDFIGNLVNDMYDFGKLNANTAVRKALTNALLFEKNNPATLDVRLRDPISNLLNTEDNKLRTANLSQYFSVQELEPGLAALFESGQLPDNSFVYRDNNNRMWWVKANGKQNAGADALFDQKKEYSSREGYGAIFNRASNAVRSGEGIIETGLSVARDLIGETASGGIFDVLKSGTRFMASLVTGRNPIFWPPSWINDYQYFTHAMATYYGTGAAADTLAKAVSYFAPALKYEAGKQSWDSIIKEGKQAIARGDDSYLRWMTEFTLAGGRFTMMDSLNFSAKGIAETLGADGYIKAARDNLGINNPNSKTLLESYDNISNTGDMANRVAAYRAIRLKGESKQRAAAMVKSFMNYEEMGSSALLKLVVPFYAFARPIIAGTSAAARQLYDAAMGTKDGGYQGLAWIGILAAISYMMTMGMDDDELEKLAPENATRNLQLPGDYQLPVTYGLLQASHAFGVLAAMWQREKITRDEAGFLMARSGFQNLAPIPASPADPGDNPGFYAMQTALPTLPRVFFTNLVQNKDDFGRPIWLEENPNRYDFENSKENTPTQFKDFAKYVFDASGKQVDVSPEFYQYMVKQAGGFGTAINRLWQTEIMRQKGIDPGSDIANVGLGRFVNRDELNAGFRTWEDLRKNLREYQKAVNSPSVGEKSGAVIAPNILALGRLSKKLDSEYVQHRNRIRQAKTDAERAAAQKIIEDFYRSATMRYNSIAPEGKRIYVAGDPALGQ